MQPYRYNEDSHALHIYGYCPNSKAKHLKSFYSEEDAVAFTKGHFIRCVTCERKRDEIIRIDVDANAQK